MIQRYVSKISGPLLDRIDIHIEVPAVKYKELRAPSSAEDSAVRQRVIAAKQTARALSEREKDLRERTDDAEDDSQALCDYSRRRENCWRTPSRGWDSPRARTIADLGGGGGIEPSHLGEAIQYKTLDQSYWA